MGRDTKNSINGGEIPKMGGGGVEVTQDGNGKVLKRNIKNIAIVYTKFNNIVLKIS